MLLEGSRPAPRRMAVAMNHMPFLTDFSMDKVEEEAKVTELPGKKTDYSSQQINNW